MVLHDRLAGYRIILGSASPRRKTLMEGLGLNLLVDPVQGVDEQFPDDMKREDVPVYLAEIKSMAYPQSLKDTDILITADTIVWLGGQVIGKPVDRADAIRMLMKLSGKCHEVLTGVMLRSRHLRHSFYARSSVWFSVLSEEEITYYVDQFQPFDKAGSYGIQEYIGYIGIEKIEGSFYNVMGLPVQMVYRELSRFAGEIEKQTEKI